MGNFITKRTIFVDNSKSPLWLAPVSRVQTSDGKTMIDYNTPSDPRNIAFKTEDDDMNRIDSIEHVDRVMFNQKISFDEPAFSSMTIHGGFDLLRS